MNDTLLGFISVALAVFFFGSFGLPLRVKQIADLNIHFVVFQLYFSCAVFVVAWAALFLSPFAFTIWGFVGAAMWVPLSLMGIVAINNLGLAIPIAVGNGITIIVSFFWGTLGFHEHVKSLPIALLALALLLLGIVGLCLCNAHIPVHLPPELGFLYYLPFLQDPAEDEELVELGSPKKFKYSESQALLHKIVPVDDHRNELTAKNWITGIGCSIIVGLLNGTVMVPTHFVPPEISMIQYFMSFAIGVLVVTLIITAVFLLVTYLLGQPLPKFHLLLGVPAGSICGGLWTCGYFFAVFATEYLGFTIGFPLTQTSLLLAGIWGMVLFKEITEIPRILMFFLSALVLLGGAFLLSINR